MHLVTTRLFHAGYKFTFFSCSKYNHLVRQVMQTTLAVKHRDEHTENDTVKKRKINMRITFHGVTLIKSSWICIII